MLRCSMTGKILESSADGIYDDGEWISWDWINQQLYEKELKAKFPKAEPEIIRLFEDFVQVAADHKQLTGRYLQVWGELGELYAEIQFGIKRHRPKTPGSDGKIGDDFVEVKTISPEKSKHKVQVKRTGNFNKLLVVRISENFEFEARMVDRKKLGKSAGKHMKIAWQAMPNSRSNESDA